MKLITTALTGIALVACVVPSDGFAKGWAYKQMMERDRIEYENAQKDYEDHLAKVAAIKAQYKAEMKKYGGDTNPVSVEPYYDPYYERSQVEHSVNRCIQMDICTYTGPY